MSILYIVYVDRVYIPMDQGISSNKLRSCKECTK